jgi:AmiR/NasT family two-component response regulator
VGAGHPERPAQIQLAEEDEMEVAMRRLLAVTSASFEQRAQLEQALHTRVVVEQAKGVLAERLRLTIDEAFELLRTTSRSNRRRLRDLAHEVLAEPETPADVVASLPTFLGRARGMDA